MELLGSSEVLKKYLRSSMKDGKKFGKEKYLFKTMENLKLGGLSEGTLISSLLVGIVEEVRPILRLKKFRKGKNFHEIGVPINIDRSYSVGLCWLFTESFKSIGHRSFQDKFYSEVRKIVLQNYSKVVVKKEDLYIEAINNRINFEFVREWKK